MDLVLTIMKKGERLAALLELTRLLSFHRIFARSLPTLELYKKKNITLFVCSYICLFVYLYITYLRFKSDRVGDCQ